MLTKLEKTVYLTFLLLAVAFCAYSSPYRTFADFCATIITILIAFAVLRFFSIINRTNGQS